MLNLSDLLRFPCNADKRPLMSGWQKNAGRFDHSRWPLVGVPTGEGNGFDCLDVDVEGLGWFEQNRKALPRTQLHWTRSGGLHLLLRHHTELRCSAGRIAPGIDVRATGGFIVWWPREGFASEVRALAPWPDWLLKLALTRKRVVSPERDLNTSQSFHIPIHAWGVGGGVAEVLFKLDPRCWNGKHDEWLALLTACKAVGVSVEDFVRWSTQDPDYAGDGDKILRKWDSAKPRHGGALWVALKQAGIKLNGSDGGRDRDRGREGLGSVEEPFPAKSTKRSTSASTTTRNWRSRLECTCNKLVCEPSEAMLFWAACVFAEVMAECKKPTPSVAAKLLEQAARQSSLWRQLGADEVHRTIANGLRHVEEKMLAP